MSRTLFDFRIGRYYFLAELGTGVWYTRTRKYGYRRYSLFGFHTALLHDRTVVRGMTLGPLQIGYAYERPRRPLK